MRSRAALAASAALALILASSVAACRDPASAPAASPRRIVAVAPSLTEILFALGLGDRVVGVGDYSRWPPEAAAKPRIGGLYNPRLETIVALEPDLAVMLPSETELASKLADLGIEILTVESETVDDVGRAIRRIAERCGAAAVGEELAAKLERELAPDPLPGAPTVMLSVARERGRLAGVLVAGPGTFLDELATRLGAVNVFADAPIPYPQVGVEEILERRPRAIVELAPEPLTEEEARELARDWEELEGLPAVAAGCVRVVAGEHTVLPGPRLPRLYRELEAALLACPSIAGAGLGER